MKSVPIRFASLLRGWMVAAMLLSFVAGVGRAARAQDGAGACGDPATLIHAIQGDGERTPLDGVEVTVEAVVVGDYQARDELQGFFLQEEDADADGDPATSDGVFVDGRLIRTDVQVGDVVRLTALALEVNDGGQWRTQLSRVDAASVTICASGVDVTPAVVTLPLADAALWEQYEGMLVRVEEQLTVTQVYNLGRYGELQVAAGGRLFQPTNMARPGPSAGAIAVENARRTFFLDDAITTQNVDPTYYPPGGLGTQNIIRSGYTLNGVTGVLDQRFGTYRLYPRSIPEFAATNPRPPAPDVAGRLRVASFNVLNYFNGDGAGGGFPTERGADTVEEFERQRAKIVAALIALDADVIGLIEIENDGDGPESAIADLTDTLNAATGGAVYDYIRDPAGLRTPDTGGDAIKQAIIYNTASVLPVGDVVTTLDPPFGARRPPLAQAFESIASGEQFVVAVNHFKSKECPAPGANADQGDGQGCWNAERVQAVEALSAWLANDPTATGDPDILLIGDLNAYTLEDPLIAFADAGYTNLVPLYEGEMNYSYVYDGLAGSLDHALASESLLDQVAGVMTWHINADEPRVFDYNLEYKTANHVETLYAPDPYRSSDHDPVVVGLDLGGAAAADFDTTPEPTAAPVETPGAPAGDGTDMDSNDPSGGMVAIAGGVVALLLAIVAAFVGRRRARTR